jgi:hypothetical protein
MSNSENTQLTPVEGYDPKQRMIFSEPILGSVPDSKPKIEFKRINISSRNEDGSEGELVFPTERLFSFGVSENVSQETQKVTGYTFPLCLWSRDGPTPQEKQWTDTFDAVVENCVDFLLRKKEDLDIFELQRSDLTKSKGGLNPLYWKKEKVKDEKTGKMVLRAVPDMGPTLYTKLIYSKKNDKFLTQFFNASDDSEQLNALDLMGKYCYTNAAVKIESIFISGTGKISLQVKLYEAVVEPSKAGMKRLLARPKARSMVLEAKNNKSISSSVMEENDNFSEDETGSLVGSENETPVVEKKTDKTKQVKRVVKKVAKA